MRSFEKTLAAERLFPLAPDFSLGLQETQKTEPQSDGIRCVSCTRVHCLAKILTRGPPELPLPGREAFGFYGLSITRHQDRTDKLGSGCHRSAIRFWLGTFYPRLKGLLIYFDFSRTGLVFPLPRLPLFAQR